LHWWNQVYVVKYMWIMFNFLYPFLFGTLPCGDLLWTDLLPLTWFATASVSNLWGKGKSSQWCYSCSNTGFCVATSTQSVFLCLNLYCFYLFYCFYPSQLPGQIEKDNFLKWIASSKLKIKTFLRNEVLFFSFNSRFEFLYIVHN